MIFVQETSTKDKCWYSIIPICLALTLSLLAVAFVTYMERHELKASVEDCFDLRFKSDCLARCECHMCFQFCAPKDAPCSYVSNAPGAACKYRQEYLEKALANAWMIKWLLGGAGVTFTIMVILIAVEFHSINRQQVYEKI